MARDMYKKLSSGEKDKLELEAQSSKNAKKFSGEEIEKEISKSMQRILREVISSLVYCLFLILSYIPLGFS